VHVSRVRVRRSKLAFDPDSGINDTRYCGELGTVHLLAIVFAKPAPQTRRLGWTTRNRQYHFIRKPLDFVPDQHTPRIKTQQLDKTVQAAVCEVEPFDKVFSGHFGSPPPDKFVQFLCLGLPMMFSHANEPKRIHDAVVPQQELKVLEQPVPIHSLQSAQVHNTLCFLAENSG